jgi:hypothetical protein
MYILVRKSTCYDDLGARSVVLPLVSRGFQGEVYFTMSGHPGILVP